MKRPFILVKINMESSRFTKNQLLKSVRQSFQVTEKLIEDQRNRVFGTSLFERSESHRWRADGVEDIPRIHNVGNPRRDSKIYDRTTL